MHSKYCKQYEINQQHKIISCFCIHCFNIQYKLYCYFKWQPYNCQTIYNYMTKVSQDFWILTQNVEKDIAKMSANSPGLWYFCYFFLLLFWHLCPSFGKITDPHHGFMKKKIQCAWISLTCPSPQSTTLVWKLNNKIWTLMEWFKSTVNWLQLI